ncbi:glycosyltransferase family 2 protein [Metabacillus iocasae]|uniref:Glycosyltransferase involved in cell wall biosynthesis n=1 Tax=Priestia iocasae TaxID=2291674 RepID=A0ABS2QS09_9BACI|nr:glycosyltransferase [Metabacillus iocasae]MBM7702250.1 glycosyltransferase involved in cell wall biosynthesis [Metabacillus iocasae]
MNTPTVSIVIPTYNRLFALAELLESLSRQTYQDFEIIIVNDGGESIDILQDVYAFLPLRIVSLTENVGHVEVRNIGVRHAAGEYIMLMDDDDLLLPTHIERMIVDIQDVDFVFSDVEMFDYRMEGITRIPTARTLFAYEYSKEGMRTFSTYVPSGSMYRRLIHEKIGEFDVSVHNYWDWDFFLRVADSFRVKRVPVASVLYAFSAEGDNQSAVQNEMRQAYLNRLCIKHELGELPIKNFWLLLEEPDVKKRKATSEVHWNGQPFASRLVGKVCTKGGV